jgi:hypothetical protein
LTCSRWSIYHVKQRSCINVSKMKLPSIGMWPMLILSWIQGHPYLVVKVAEIQRDKKKKKNRERKEKLIFYSSPMKLFFLDHQRKSTVISLQRAQYFPTENCYSDITMLYSQLSFLSFFLAQTRNKNRTGMPVSRK